MLLVAGNLVFLHVPSRPPEPVSTRPLEQESQGLLSVGFRESKNKGSFKGSQDTGPNVRHHHFSCVLLIKASHRLAQVQKEENKLHLLMKNLQSECKKAFEGCCTHLWKTPNTPTHSFMCNHPSRYVSWPRPLGTFCTKHLLPDGLLSVSLYLKLTGAC